MNNNSRNMNRPCQSGRMTCPRSGMNMNNRPCERPGMDMNDRPCERPDMDMKSDRMRMNNSSPDRARIIQNVYELGFVMTEMLLYLDTHPNEQEAIEYYTVMKRRYNDAVEAYEMNIGPLTFTSTSVDNYFNWEATPLPWEKEGF